MIRIGIVNDMRMAQESLRRVVVSMPGAVVAWMAQDGEEAVRRCREDTPDVVLMDLIMPVMDGVEATRRIMQDCPCPILVVTATVDGNAARVYEALGYGALDAVNTPVLGTGGELTGAEPLIRKIRTLEKLAGVSNSAVNIPAAGPPQAPPQTAHGGPQIVAIGSSTGGPQALLEVLKPLREVRNLSIVIVQHLDRHFVPGLAEWLANETAMTVRAIESCESLQPGTVYLACTDDHLILNTYGRLTYVRQPEDAIHRPSVDVFFESLLHAPVRPGTAILLTGMGRDGAVGMKALKEAGWDTIAQDQATSVVWGMPGAAVRIQAARRVLPVDQIGRAVRVAMNGRGSESRS